VIGLATVMSALLLVSRPAAGQTPTGAAQPYTPPRTSDGQPRIEGVWHGNPGGSYSIEDLELQAIYQQRRRDESRRGRSRIIDPADGKIPYQPWAAAKAKDIFDNHLDPRPEHLDPVSRCVVQGVPRAMYQGEYQILQSPGQIVFLIEPVHQYRVIPLDGRPHPPENIKLFMGSSRGRWEGNTLVVHSTNFNNLTWFAIVGSFHSDAMQIVERFTIVDANTISYRATIEDPKVYTRPWTLGVQIQRMTDYEILEEACHEGERSAQNILTRPGR
jgi:hypothetical protein